MPTIWLTNACSHQTKNKVSHRNLTEQYDFHQPERIISLPKELNEISGLSYEPLNDMLITLNDEKGIIFYINCNSNSPIFETKHFSSKGDYEGIEYINKTTYCLKSNGTIISVSDDTNNTTNSFHTPFTSKNNTEGLGVDLNKENLLIACKGETLKKQNHTKAIYAFNIKKKKLNKSPVLIIKIKKLKDYIDQTTNDKDECKKRKKRIEEFAPSAIATNEKNKLTYILSARGSSMIIFNQQNEIKNIVFLNPEDIPQPEGICFDKKDNLYISTEGKKGSGKIFIYKKKSN